MQFLFVFYTCTVNENAYSKKSRSRILKVRKSGLEGLFGRLGRAGYPYSEVLLDGVSMGCPIGVYQEFDVFG